ncbi:MAG: lipoate--protein ligase family protein [Nitrospirae bacterium]|nr:lipoate--protein ligase family protein [Nitrospirota bacterium]
MIDSGPCSAFYNMALDEALATSVRKDGLPPTLRLYGWDRPSLSLGCFQKPSDINLDYCSEKCIPVVRRPTGGRAILHGDELTYSFSVRTGSGLFSKGLLDSYKKIGAAFNLAFHLAGISAFTRDQREKGRVLAGSPLCFQSSSYGEILVDSRKLAGSAQKRWEDGLLQQGSIPYCLNEDETARIFGLKGKTALRDCMACVRDFLPALDEEKFRQTIADAFEHTFKIRFERSCPLPEEETLAQELVTRKYLLDWRELRQAAQ